MDKNKINYILDIFRTLSTEVPEQMLYRENGDSIELRTLDYSGDCLPLVPQDSGWKLVGCQMVEAA